MSGGGSSAGAGTEPERAAAPADPVPAAAPPMPSEVPPTDPAPAEASLGANPCNDVRCYNQTDTQVLTSSIGQWLGVYVFTKYHDNSFDVVHTARRCSCLPLDTDCDRQMSEQTYESKSSGDIPPKNPITLST